MKPTWLESFWRRVQKTDGCWEWIGSRTSKGYGRFEREFAHRVSWSFVHGPVPPGLYICHHCDNPPCVRPDHLFLGTAGDNNRDAVMKGRHRSHTLGGTKKLSPSAVLDIRSSDLRRSELAKKYGVSEEHVGNVIKRKIWRFVPDTKERLAVPDEIRPLSEMQRRILCFLVHHINEHGFPPTVREIVVRFNLPSTSSAAYHISVLERKEYIERNPRVARGIRVLGSYLPFSSYNNETRSAQ